MMTSRTSQTSRTSRTSPKLTSIFYDNLCQYARSSVKAAEYYLNVPGDRTCKKNRMKGSSVKPYRRSCYIDTDSKLRNSRLTNKRFIHQLQTRPIRGAFKGAGSGSLCHKDIESKLIMGEDTRGQVLKSRDVLAGVTIDRFHILPNYGNPQRVKHIIEPWVRGGDNTRDHIRQINYTSKLKNKRTSKIVNQ
jgi:hypothetical protein